MVRFSERVVFLVGVTYAPDPSVPYRTASTRICPQENLTNRRGRHGKGVYMESRNEIKNWFPVKLCAQPVLCDCLRSCHVEAS